MTDGSECTIASGTVGQLAATWLRTVAKPLFDEPTNLLVLSEWQRAPVPFPRFLWPAEPAEHVGTSEVKGAYRSRAPLPAMSSSSLRPS